MAKKKFITKKLLSQAMMFLFLLMIVLGFTIHLDNSSSNGAYVEPRVCRHDTDCYLVCNGEVIKVLCYNNLCQMNSCEQTNFYPYNEEAMTITLEGINLTNYQSDHNIFVKFKENNQVKLHTSGLYLDMILEKTGSKQINEMYVNGNQSFAFTNYLPQDGDMITIVR